MATLCLFLSQHQHDEFVQQLIKHCFTDFFNHQVSKYTNASQLPINAVGSVAFYFKKYFQEVATQQGYKVGEILQSPIQGLIKYHSN